MARLAFPASFRSLTSSIKTSTTGRRRSFDYVHAPWHRGDAFGVAIADEECVGGGRSISAGSLLLCGLCVKPFSFARPRRRNGSTQRRRGSRAGSGRQLPHGRRAKGCRCRNANFESANGESSPRADFPSPSRPSPTPKTRPPQVSLSRHHPCIDINRKRAIPWALNRRSGASPCSP